MKNFTQLEIWKEAKDLAVYIFKITNNTNFRQDLSFRDQIRRSCISIPSNIAEGFERDSTNEFIRFLRIAKGSSAELITQLTIASEVKLIEKQIFLEITNRLKLLNSKIGKMISYLKHGVKDRRLSKSGNHKQPVTTNQPTSQPANQQTSQLANQQTQQTSQPPTSQPIPAI